MTRLTAEQVSFAYGAHQVLRRVDLALEEGSFTLLAGRNGAGKSTLLGILAGIRKPTAGSVLFGTDPIGELPSMTRARTITLIPQNSDTSFDFSGRELVMMGRHPHIPRFGLPGAADHAAVDDALRLTDATEFAERSVRTLSGGEVRRIHIARALATQAPILLADEPTANLDLEHAVAILQLLQRLATQGRTVLVSSHDLNLIAPRCDRVALLHETGIHTVGSPEDVLREDVVAEVFGVDSRAPTGFFPREYDALS